MALSPRPARAPDAPAIAEIHNRIIRETTITFTTVERSADEVAALLRSGVRHWALEMSGGVAGFAALGPFRQGPGYARSFEHTVMLAPDSRGAGGGRALMAAVEDGARAAGGHCLIAGIGGENEAAAAFHAALGFVPVGRLPQVGWKFGRWQDLVFMQKILSRTGPGR